MLYIFTISDVEIEIGVSDNETIISDDRLTYEQTLDQSIRIQILDLVQLYKRQERILQINQSPKLQEVQ